MIFAFQMAPATVTAAPPEEEEVDYEEMGVAETYAEYWPAKCKLHVRNSINIFFFISIFRLFICKFSETGQKASRSSGGDRLPLFR